MSDRERPHYHTGSCLFILSAAQISIQLPFYHHSNTILSNPISMPARLLYADLASGRCLLPDPTCRAAFIGFTTWLAYCVPPVAMEANSQAGNSLCSTDTSKSQEELSRTQGLKEMLTCWPAKLAKNQISFSGYRNNTWSSKNIHYWKSSITHIITTDSSSVKNIYKYLYLLFVA